MANPLPLRDVAIVGGGPAGATVAAHLARDGYRVVLFERERFPRFHIGESLLPAAIPHLQALGIDLAREGQQKKDGAEFIDEALGQCQTYNFRDGLNGSATHAFNVERSTFDAMLLSTAGNLGVEIHEGEAAKDFEVERQEVRVQTAKARYRFRYLVDASGGHVFSGRRLRTIEPIKGMGRAAVFAHFDGIRPAIVDELGAHGNIKVLRVEDGWAWLIPLANGRLSLGAVVRSEKADNVRLERVIAQSALLSRVTEGSRSTTAHIVGNYSHRNVAPYGSRFAAVGDAACFLDPVFSSGVTLALESATVAAGRISRALADDREHEAQLMAPLGHHLSRGYRCFYMLIRRFYHSAMFDNLFFAGNPDPEFRRGLISMLAGDVWREDNALQNMMLAARRRRLPAWLDLGDHP